jgi:hypothetical protein
MIRTGKSDQPLTKSQRIYHVCFMPPSLKAFDTSNGTKLKRGNASLVPLFIVGSLTPPAKRNDT